MNNSALGKTMENLRKKVKVTLVNNAKDCKKYISKPSFGLQKMILFMKLHLHKPIHVGFSILDLSKFLFDFSDYPKDSKCSDPVDKKVIGKIKNEDKGDIITEFVGLKSKRGIL